MGSGEKMDSVGMFESGEWGVGRGVGVCEIFEGVGWGVGLCGVLMGSMEYVGCLKSWGRGA